MAKIELRSLKPPALTTGLFLFCLILQFANVYGSLVLKPDTLNLNRLNFFGLVFPNLKTLLVQYLLFAPILGIYELRNGTVRAGVILNVGAILPALFTCLICRINVPVLDTFRQEQFGTLGYTLIFGSILALQSRNFSFKNVNLGYVVPIGLFVALVMYNPSSLILRFFEIVLGVGLGTGVLGFLVNGTAKPVAWIESKLTRPINILSLIVVFVKERDVRQDYESLADDVEMDALTN